MVWVSTAVQDLTPPEPLPLGGYTERKGALGQEGERLHARVVVIRQGARRVALVSFETLTIPESLTREVRARLPGDLGLMLVATHTHCAPDSQMLNERMTLGVPGISDYRSRWLRWTSERLASAVQLALAAEARPVRTVELLRTVLPEANRNRRGGVPPDPRASVVLGDGQPLWASFSAHATVLDEKHLKLSGDWPGAFMRLSGVPFFPGAIGDASPVTLAKGGAGCEELGGKLAGSLRGTGWIVGPGRLGWGTGAVQLAKPVPHPAFAASYKVPEVLAAMMVGKFAPSGAEVSALALGRLAVVGIPGEPTGDVGRRIEAEARKAGFWACVVVSHCNGWMGYVLEPTDYDRGGYEANLAFHGREAADRLVEACRGALDSVKPPPDR